MERGMKKCSLWFAILLFSTGVSANCMVGEIGPLTLEPKAGYKNPDFAGKARFAITNSSNVTEYSYIGEEQQNFNSLYSTILAAKTSKSLVEVCWDSNAIIGSYKRMNRVVLQ